MRNERSDRSTRNHGTVKLFDDSTRLIMMMENRLLHGKRSLEGSFSWWQPVPILEVVAKLWLQGRKAVRERGTSIRTISKIMDNQPHSQATRPHVFRAGADTFEIITKTEQSRGTMELAGGMRKTRTGKMRGPRLVLAAALE
jgi:hypothetical protein